MKKNFLLPVLLILFYGACSDIHAQALRLNLINYSPFAEDGSKYGLYLGFGYEQNVGKKIAVSLEYNNSYSLGEDDYTENYYRYTDDFGSGYSFYYGFDMPWTEFSYQSKYFFADNTDNSWYFSSGIAMRSVHYTTVISDANYDWNYAYMADALQQGNHVQDITLIPISFKLGRRGEFEDFFSDFYFGLNFIPGAAGKLQSAGIDAGDVEYKKIQGINFCIGWNLGFSWLH